MKILILLILILLFFSNFAYAETSTEWVKKGNLLREQGDYIGAIKAYDKAITLDPNSAIPWNNRGLALVDLGRYDEAIDAYDQAIALGFNNTYLWTYKGRALVNLERYEDAIEAFDQAIAFDQNYIFTWYGKGDALASLGKYEEAIEAYDQAIAIDQNNVYPWLKKGLALAGMEQYKEAIEAYDQAIAIDPNYIYAWDYKGNAFFNLKRYEEAIEAYDRVIFLEKNNTYTLYNKGLALYNLGRYNEAIEAYDQAISSDQYYAKPWNSKGLALVKLGWYEEAIEAYDKAIDIDPDNPTYLKNKKKSEEALKPSPTFTREKPSPTSTREKPSIEQLNIPSFLLPPIEFLAQIPGKDFLLIFVALVITTIIICHLWIKADGSRQYPLPELTSFDSIGVALLSGGVYSVIQTTVFRLWDRKLIDINGEGSNATLEVKKQSQQNPSGAVETEVYQFLQSPKKPKDIFKDASLQNRIKMHVEPIQRELEQLHLSRTESGRKRAWGITAIAFLVIFGVGGTKYHLGKTFGYPSDFLFGLLLGSVIVLLFTTFAFGYLDITTSLGRRYLKEMNEHFGWLKDSIDEGNVPEGIDPSLAVALGGIGVLAGSALYQPYSEVFSPEKSTGGSGGGCGGGGGGGGCGGGGCGG